MKLGYRIDTVLLSNSSKTNVEEIVKEYADDLAIEIVMLLLRFNNVTFSLVNA